MAEKTYLLGCAVVPDNRVGYPQLRITRKRRARAPYRAGHTCRSTIADYGVVGYGQVGAIAPDPSAHLASGIACDDVVDYGRTGRKAADTPAGPVAHALIRGPGIIVPDDVVSYGEAGGLECMKPMPPPP